MAKRRRLRVRVEGRQTTFGLYETELVEVADRFDLTPPGPVAPLPSLAREEIRLVAWMAVATRHQG